MARERIHAARYAVDGKPDHFRFPFDVKPESLNRTSGRHWGTKHKTAKDWRLEIRSICGLPPSDLCREQVVNGRPILSIDSVVKLTITMKSARRTGRRRARDRVNRYASVKPVEDALVHWGWMWDDDDVDHGGFCELEVLEVAELDVAMVIELEVVRGSRGAEGGVSRGGGRPLEGEAEEKREASAGRSRAGRRGSFRRGRR